MHCTVGAPERRGDIMWALRGDHCRCSACNVEFNSTAAFDKHRIGTHTGRRCRTISEMRAAGMVLSSTGWWITSKTTGTHPYAKRRSGDCARAGTSEWASGEPLLESTAMEAAGAGRDAFHASMIDRGGEAA
jgi:hypothetical protein